MVCRIISMEESRNAKNVVCEKQRPLSRSHIGGRMKLNCMLQKHNMRCGLDFGKCSARFSKTVELLG